MITDHVPAVRVWDGDVTAVTTFSSQLTGATDCVDGDNKPVGAWVARSGGGFTIVGTANDSAVGNAKVYYDLIQSAALLVIHRHFRTDSYYDSVFPDRLLVAFTFVSDRLLVLHRYQVELLSDRLLAVAAQRGWWRHSLQRERLRHQ